MLQLKPNCECCDKDLPADATDARICSFECTFCAQCVNEILNDVCPNCGGGFVPRPIRPCSDHRDGNFLGTYPASTTRVVKPVDTREHAKFAAGIKTTPPEQR